MLNPTTISVPDFTPEEHARFDANDHAAEQAIRWADLACGDAGPFPSTGPTVPDFDLADLPF